MLVVTSNGGGLAAVEAGVPAKLVTELHKATLPDAPDILNEMVVFVASGI